MKATILIIEDSQEQLENTDELLKLAGYQTFLAHNGKEGLTLAREHKPDLILCDVVMPELDGYGVLRALENIPELAATPLIFMSVNTERADFRKGMDLGADDYLPKPFNGDELLNIVGARLRKRRLLHHADLKAANGFPGKGEVSAAAQNLDVLLEHKTRKKLKKKELLFLEGNSAMYLYYVCSGKIKSFKSNKEGKEYIADIYGKGDFIGYAALMGDGIQHVSAMAIEDSELCLVPKHDFLQLLSSNTDVALKFACLMSGNYSQAEDKLLKLAYDSARKRVAEALLLVSQKYRTPGNGELAFPLQRENISALSGVSPESVSRNLTDFKTEGLIEPGKGCVRILNLKKLEELKN
jgi:CRP-like cAMP-binding protein